MTPDVIIQAIVSGLLMGLVYALVAVGPESNFGLMEIVNFAHGEFLMLSMVLQFLALGSPGARSAHIVATGCYGARVPRIATHYGIIRHILNAPMLAQICATFGLAIAIRSRRTVLLDA